MSAIKLDGSTHDILWVQAIKLFPNDKARRDQLFTLESVRFEVLGLGGDLDLVIPVSANVLQTLFESPGYTEMMNLAQEAAKRACIAADILCTIYLMDRFGLPVPSLNKAMAVVQAYAPTTAYGRRLEVAHFHNTDPQVLGRVQTGSTSLGCGADQQRLPLHENHKSMYTEDFKSYLQVAQGFYHFGVAFSPKRLRSPVRS